MFESTCFLDTSEKTDTFEDVPVFFSEKLREVPRSSEKLGFREAKLPRLEDMPQA